MTIPESDLARARGRLAEVIGAEIVLKPKGREFAGLCPFHNEKSPSFYVFGGANPHYHCFGCSAHGDAIGFVMRRRNLEFAAAVRWILGLPEGVSGRCAGVPAQLSAQNDRDSRSADRQHQIAAILRECDPIARRTAAQLYLWSRGLNLDQPALLAHPALYCHEIGKPLPALVAPLTDSRGEVTAIQRIWCMDRIESVNGQGPQDARAPLATRKKTLGPMGNGAVRLAPPGAILGLAEGIESAIAASMMFRLPVWAVCGVSRLGYPAHWSEPKDGSKPRWIEERPPTVWIPPEVSSLYIFGDRGLTGESVAEFAARWWHMHGRNAPTTQAVFPDPGYSDFADQLIGRRSVA